ncbi:hypothetical protein GF380_04475, partial [Candidatus Uhrbacteria bacterium]|nr:hypothetical protein [Candidatus Uhrbacteria bacterium]MBD3284316.1 hypothetical protein [Candidatus Uhrbacteria bacterium]
FHTASDSPSEWDLKTIEQSLKTMLPPTADVHGRLSVCKTELEGKLDLAERRTHLIECMMVWVRDSYDALEKQIGEPSILTEVEKVIFLRAMDDAWINHLENIGHLRHGIGLQGYGQRDPLVEYKKQAFRMFNEMQYQVNRQVAHMIFRVQFNREHFEREHLQQSASSSSTTSNLSGGAMAQAANDRADVGARHATSNGSEKIGRNDPCFCGSGKKYKKCHGA